MRKMQKKTLRVWVLSKRTLNADSKRYANFVKAVQSPRQRKVEEDRLINTHPLASNYHRSRKNWKVGSPTVHNQSELEVSPITDGVKLTASKGADHLDVSKTLKSNAHLKFLEDLNHKKQKNSVPVYRVYRTVPERLENMDDEHFNEKGESLGIRKGLGEIEFNGMLGDEEATLWTESEAWSAIQWVNLRHSYSKSVRYSDRFFRAWTLRLAEQRYSKAHGSSVLTNQDSVTGTDSESLGGVKPRSE